MTSRTQCSVPSAESYGALPAEASPLVSRETGLSPRETAVMPPTPVRQRTLSLSDCHASPTDSTRSVPLKADLSATFFRGSSRSHPVGHDVLNGRPLPGTGRRHHVASHVRRHAPYLPPRRETASRLISSLRSHLLRSVTSAESHGALPSDASPLVSRETDSRAWCGRHGGAPTSPPRPALPG